MSFVSILRDNPVSLHRQRRRRPQHHDQGGGGELKSCVGDKHWHVVARPTDGCPTLGRRLNSFLGLSLNDRTILFLVILLDKTVSVG